MGGRRFESSLDYFPILPHLSLPVSSWLLFTFLPNKNTKKYFFKVLWIVLCVWICLLCLQGSSHWISPTQPRGRRRLLLSNWRPVHGASPVGYAFLHILHLYIMSLLADALIQRNVSLRYRDQGIGWQSLGQCGVSCLAEGHFRHYTYWLDKDSNNADTTTIWYQDNH